MPRSSAQFIAYDLRPAKQAERRILLDFLECAKEGGLEVSDCRYVGMGGFKFYDFILMHRYVGLNKMVSLEHVDDERFVKRCRYNKPFNFIKVLNLSCREFLNKDKYAGRSIFWLDYDDGLGVDILEDIQVLGARLAPGSLAFVTVAGDVPAHLRDATESERLQDVKERYGEFALGLELGDMEDVAFPRSIYRILYSAMVNAFSSRMDGNFSPDLRILYRDTTNMVTVGGYFCSPEIAKRVARRVKRSLPFLPAEPGPFKLRNFNLSERERHLIEFASTKRKGSREEAKLRELGFKTAELHAYRDLVRFIPRYFETLF